MRKSRSEISKAAWRKRKRVRAYKALCAFCGKPIWAKGVRAERRAWHKGCFEAHQMGLTPKMIGRNPSKTAHIKRYVDLLIAESKVSPTDREKRKVLLTRAEEHYMGAVAMGAIQKEFQREIEKRKREMGGRNPVRREPRDAFRFYGARPLNPSRWHRARFKGTCAYCTRGIYAGGVRYKGRLYHETCRSLMARGVPKGIVPNPLERRPPREWFAEMLPGLRASYPGASPGRLGQIASGIWWGFTPAQRQAYRKRHTLPSRIIHNPLLRGERYLGRTKWGVPTAEAKRRGWL